MDLVSTPGFPLVVFLFIIILVLILAWQVYKDGKHAGTAEVGRKATNEKGTAFSTACPFCGSPDIFLTSNSSVQSVDNPIFAFGGGDNRPAYECRACCRVFVTPIEICKNDGK